MSEMVAPVFVTPQRGVDRPPTVSIVQSGKPLSEGIRLIHNTQKYGYILDKPIEGFGLAPVENTTVEAARGGSSLRHRRWGEGDMFLPVTLASPNPESMYDMFARLVSVVTNQNDYFDVVFFDPYSQEARRRTVLYDSGLETVNEVSPTLHRVGITAKFLSPFWRGPERVVTERIAPPVKPLITADPGSPVNRWDDPEFGDSTAYEPWFVVDGGLEKQGTGDEHGTFVGNHRIEVSPGETVSVSADVSYVDGPNVGDIQVKVRAYDDTATLVAGSEQTVISEAYGGTYTGTYVVPGTGASIELGFYTATDVHANTRVRIDNLDVKRDVQYLARYEWEGEPHNSPSIKRDHTGNIVARNESYGAPNLFSNVTFDTSFDNSSLNPLTYTGSGTTYVGYASGLHRVTPGDYFAHAVSFDWGDGDIGRIRHQVQFRGPNNESISSSHVTPDKSDYPDGGRISAAYLVPEGAWEARVYEWFYLEGDFTPPTTGSKIRVGKFSAVSADSEQGALDQVATYFDGDTQDIIEVGSREGSYSFPFFPVFLADSTVQGEHELRVEGDAPVWPVWEITGPGRDVEIIGPDGSRLFVEGEVTTPITIVTEPGKRSIRDASGLIWDRMKPGDDQFFALEPGEQVVKMTMVGGNPQSTIKAVYAENWKTPRGTAQGMIRGGTA